MKFHPCPLSGVYRIEPEPHTDERGAFARTYCRREFEQHGLNADIAQCNTSFNTAAFTLRGMHFQAAPHEEDKVVRCTRGAIFDVAVDLRRDSPTHCGWFGAELSADNGHMLYIPKGFAHGFLTLLPGSEVYYQMSAYYEPGAGRGVRWNDPAFGIRWPHPVATISERDATYPDYAP